MLVERIFPLCECLGDGDAWCIYLNIEILLINSYDDSFSTFAFIELKNIAAGGNTAA